MKSIKNQKQMKVIDETQSDAMSDVSMDFYKDDKLTKKVKIVKPKDIKKSMQSLESGQDMKSLNTDPVCEDEDMIEVKAPKRSKKRTIDEDMNDVLNEEKKI